MHAYGVAVISHVQLQGEDLPIATAELFSVLTDPVRCRSTYDLTSHAPCTPTSSMQEVCTGDFEFAL